MCKILNAFSYAEDDLNRVDKESSNKPADFVYKQPQTLYNIMFTLSRSAIRVDLSSADRSIRRPGSAPDLNVSSSGGSAASSLRDGNRGAPFSGGRDHVAAEAGNRQQPHR